MSNQPSRSAPLVTMLTIMVGFALFLAVIYYVYLPRQTGPFTDDGIHTMAQRRKNLEDLRKKQHDQVTHYAWVDQKAGVVQLPLDVAMKLTVEKYTSQK
jgi:hypothetical protein